MTILLETGAGYLLGEDGIPFLIEAPLASNGTFFNHVLVQTPRNGTTTHTVASDGTGGTVTAGAAFTPTVGRYLVCIIAGAVTSTQPTGWVMSGTAGGSGLYVARKTATGSDTVTTTHNGSDYPVAFHFLEFKEGTSFGSLATAPSTVNGSVGPSISPSGTNWTAGLVSIASSSVGTSSFTWAGGTELVDVIEPKVTGLSDGYNYSMTYTANDTTTPVTYTATGTNSTSRERIVFNLKVAA